MLLLETTQRESLLSLLQIFSSTSQVAESLFLAQNGYTLYCSVLQSLLTLAKHSSDSKDTASYLNILLSFSFPPYFTDTWLATLVNASLLAIQVTPVQLNGVRTLSRLLVVESERVLSILDEPHHRRTFVKAINDCMACVSNSELHSAMLKLIGALGGWMRDHVNPIPCSMTTVPKPDSVNCYVFELDDGMRLSLSHDQLILECSHVLSNFAKYPENMSMMLAQAKHKALGVLISLFDAVYGVSESTESIANETVNLLSNGNSQGLNDNVNLQTAYLYVLFLAACNPVLHPKTVSLLRKCAYHFGRMIIQNSNFIPALQTRWEDVVTILGPMPPNFVCDINPEFEFIFVAFIRLLRGNGDFVLSVACEWVQLLHEQLQNVPPEVFHAFFDNFVTAMISLGYEEGWKTQLRICSVFNFILSLFDNRWAYRVISIFLRFYLQTLNVSIGEDCDAGHSSQRIAARVARSAKRTDVHIAGQFQNEVCEELKSEE